MADKYQIVIKGHLDSHWASWFDGMAVHYDEHDNTVLTGSVVDQPALHGLLEQVRSLNLTLLTVIHFEQDTDNSQQ